jgi:hypothetical protein
MKQLVSISAAVICALLTSSSVAGDGVFAGDNEWLQPADFLGYSPLEVAAVCPPPSGLCSGFLPGSNIDLTGYTWASLTDVVALYNEDYDADPPVELDLFDSYSGVHEFSSQISSDFQPVSSIPTVDCNYLLAVGGLAQYYSKASNAYFLIGTADPDCNDSYGYVSYDQFCASCSDDEQQPWFLRDERGAWFWREAPFKVHLEEPVKGQVHSGIGSLRGWAIAEDGIERVEVYIDGNYAYDAPYGGPRGDVEEKFPEIDGSGQSGFSMAFSYSNLSFGQHTIIENYITL